ncbi:1-phosphofructokinase family hexose kinase [Mycolicibacterium sphagni]|uniref:1-phosphofructokinase family hexose kinase n=1 Tax=Mycolicibacterium sphagni TaxID=1786 RepID=A0ABX2JZ99_9MYCO|nr:1-phosphofructokinase family hexose kinase [Mycolicibacterium sphagni]NTY63066.1 1-phosphofructokinase family hexose kinase [Mycolicibacterium sphagni]
MNEFAVAGHRIVTLTMNPALDITTSTELVHSTDKLRCAAARYDPGGGGINVAHVAEVLGASATAVFPAGGPAGDMVHNLLVAEGLAVRRIRIGGSTRESFAVDERSTGKQYRFVLPGPELTLAEQTECLLQLRTAAASAAIVVASGSLPPGVPPDFYQQVADVCADIGAMFLLDTSGVGLRHVNSGVFLLKPSLRELRECVGRELATETEQLAAAHELINRGCADHVLVSLGAQGALLATRQGGHRFPPVHVPAGSGVGAGDAMVAGVAVGLTRGWPLTKAVRLGIAAGAAMLLTPGTAPCTRYDAERLFELADNPGDVELVTG